MARPQPHPTTGVFRARIAVPAELRSVIGKRELIRTLGTKDAIKGRRLFPAAHAALVAIIAAAREELGGNLRRVSPREVATLAGEEYRAKVSEAESDPGRREDRELDLEFLLDRLTGYHEADGEDERQFVPEARDLDDARAFLRQRGIAGDADSVARMAVALWSARQFCRSRRDQAGQR